MGKRSSFPRNKHDAYDTTDPRPVARLLPHLPAGSRFIEPCVGAGALLTQLEAAGHRCVGAFDIELRFATSGEDAQRTPVWRGDAAKFSLKRHYYDADLFISNPAWTPEILLPIILNLYWQRPTWFLLSADFAHAGYAAPYMPVCSLIVSAGRVKWVQGSPHSAKDNAAWYRFEARQRPEFVGAPA